MGSFKRLHQEIKAVQLCGVRIGEPEKGARQPPSPIHPRFPEKGTEVRCATHIRCNFKQFNRVRGQIILIDSAKNFVPDCLRIGKPHYRLKMRDYISSRSSFLRLDSSEAKRFRSSVKSKATVSSALAGRLAATLLMQKWDLPKLMIFLYASFNSFRSSLCSSHFLFDSSFHFLLSF